MLRQYIGRRRRAAAAAAAGAATAKDQKSTAVAMAPSSEGRPTLHP